MSVLTEYFMFQNLVGSLELSQAAMAEDLANLSAQNETLKNEVDTIPSLKQKLQVHNSTRQRFIKVAAFPLKTLTCWPESP